MNKKNEELLIKSVNTVKKLLCVDESEIMLTGSLALALYGVLPFNREVHDVDMIIKIPFDKWRLLKLLASIKGDENNEEYHSDKQVMLDIDGVKLNIWNEGFGTADFLKEPKTGVYVKSLFGILCKKKEYHRQKDYEDINDICRKILI